MEALVPKYTPPPLHHPSAHTHALMYEGCEKAYIYEYKLKLHLGREHHGHVSDENAENAQPNNDNEMDETSDQDAYVVKRGSAKSQKQSKRKLEVKMLPSKRQRKGSSASPTNLNTMKKQWPVKEEKFLDSSKLKRHFLIHTGERHFVCPHEGCGKAFSLDFNLRSHMKTHSLKNYHVCPYPECEKRYAHEYKLKNHLTSHHEKNVMEVVPKYTPPLPAEKPPKVSKPSAGAYGSASSERPYACPYEGCEKAYIHEYKLELHLRREHPGHVSDENAENAQPNNDNEMDEARDQDAYVVKRGSAKSQKQSKRKPEVKMPPSKSQRKGSSASPANLNTMKKQWPVKEEVYGEEEDSEETEEEDRDNVDGWRYTDNNEDDDEETEYEDYINEN